MEYELSQNYGTLTEGNAKVLINISSINSISQHDAVPAMACMPITSIAWTEVFLRLLLKSIVHKIKRI